MKTKLLKIFNDLGWIHEEEGQSNCVGTDRI